MKKDTARLIITMECERNCGYCCNNYKHIIGQAKTIRTLREIQYYKYVCVTGGEPMLRPSRTKRILKKLHELNPTVKIFLYTALYNIVVNVLVTLVVVDILMEKVKL